MYTPMLKNLVNGCHGNHAFYHSAIEFFFEDKILCISGVPGNDLAPMKKMPLGCIKLAPGVFKLWAFIEENVCPTYARTNV